MRVPALIALALSGCTWIGNTADDLGSHLPVVGERCEHWQCMTDKGRAISKKNSDARTQANTLQPPAQ